MERVNHIKAAISAAVAIFTALFGWVGWLVIGWIALMTADILTGLGKAVKSGSWSSKVMREGLLHKAGSLTAVLVAAVLDLVISQVVPQLGISIPIHYTAFLFPLALFWYILTEAGSVVENIGEMGAPVPKWLRKAIATLRDTVDQAADNDNQPDLDNQ